MHLQLDIWPTLMAI